MGYTQKMPAVTLTLIEFLCGCGEIGHLHISREGDRERYVPHRLVGHEAELAGDPTLAEVLSAVRPQCNACQALLTIRHIHSVRGLPRGAVPPLRLI